MLINCYIHVYARSTSEITKDYDLCSKTHISKEKSDWKRHFIHENVDTFF